MRVLITGGAGFIGQRLLRSLLARGHLPDAAGTDRTITSIVIIDRSLGPGRIQDERIAYETLDIADPDASARVLKDPFDSIFHLAAVVSATAEADFLGGWRANLDGSRNLFEACRIHSSNHPPTRLVFASSVAVFGGVLPEVVDDATAPTPQGSYGSQKLATEILLADYSRKGYLDARALRVPTIVVRPGRPNGAASGFASAIIREPLAGQEALCPVAPDTLMWIASPGAAVAALLHAHLLPATMWGAPCALNLPGLTVRIQDMVQALTEIAGAAIADRIAWKRDPAIEALVRSWPARFNTARAHRLGFFSDHDFRGILDQYRADTLH
jgi:nucleoside-diphosphate-sugar epimerase